MKIRKYSKVYWIVYNNVSKKYPAASNQRKHIITHYATKNIAKHAVKE